jgi:hypothetical protein
VEGRNISNLRVAGWDSGREVFVSWQVEIFLTFGLRVGIVVEGICVVEGRKTKFIKSLVIFGGVGGWFK